MAFIQSKGFSNTYTIFFNFILQICKSKMNTITKIIGAGALVYLIKVGNDYYQASKNVQFRPTGIRLEKDPQGLFQIKIFTEIANLSRSAITVDKISGSVVASNGTLLGYYSGGKAVLNPGVNNYTLIAKLDNMSIVTQLIQSIISGRLPKTVNINNSLFLGVFPLTQTVSFPLSL
jgi:hypothetical protein